WFCLENVDTESPVVGAGLPHDEGIRPAGSRRKPLLHEPGGEEPSVGGDERPAHPAGESVRDEDADRMDRRGGDEDYHPCFEEGGDGDRIQDRADAETERNADVAVADL